MRIQILPLPSVVVGEDVEEPFALIVDEFDGFPSEAEAAQWSKFAQDCGARAIAFSEKTVDVVDRYLPDPVPAEPLMRVADPIVPPREFDPYARLVALKTSQQVLEGVAKIRALRELQDTESVAATSPYGRGMRNGLEWALSILEGRAATFPSGPADGCGPECSEAHTYESSCAAVSGPSWKADR